MRKIYTTSFSLLPRSEESFKIGNTDMMKVLDQQFPDGEAMDRVSEIMRVFLERNGRFDMLFCASYIFQLGRIEGIRQERARRKGKLL